MDFFEKHPAAAQMQKLASCGIKRLVSIWLKTDGRLTQQLMIN